jgi:ubiquinone/menaquinone biosynthesis C-methylase UbiE
VADALGTEDRTVEELASLCHADTAALNRLLRAMASFGLVKETAPHRFALTPAGEPLRKDAPNSEWFAIVFWADLIADSWSHLTECVSSGENAMNIAKRDGIVSRWLQDPGASDVFRAVMGTAPADDYMRIAQAWDFSPYRVVADLGGGGGTLIAAILISFPQLRGMLVDRAESIERAKPRFEAGAFAGRCELIAADLSEAVPPGADVYMLKHVLHGCEDEAAINILRNCRSVLAPQGRLLVVEFVLPDVVDHPDIELEQRLMSDLNMLILTGGKERSAAEWKDLLLRAGFQCRGVQPVAGELVSIIEAMPQA